ncbi:MAG: hypothetical protein AUF64_02935 [Chloroflexi bacterium 13_1_20CM_54_36]|nr:MAG: hypothetical protein AUF64_02935 [Chloroflexi bacterium 13_1_20CM_54_36]
MPLYAQTRDGGYAQFYQYVINRIDGNNLNDPPVTLGDLLKLPPISDLQEHVLQQPLKQLEQDYLERPKLLYDIAKFYMGKVGDAWKIAPDMPPSEQTVSQEASTAGVESYIHVIAEVIPVGTLPPQDKIATAIYNKIKHIFLVTENLSAYVDQTDPIQIVSAPLKRDPTLVQDWIDGIKSAAGFMNDIASLLLFLDHLGVPF